MKTTVIIDVIVAAILLAFTLAGGVKGLFRSLSGLVIVVVALIGATAAAKALTPPVTEFLRPYLEQRVTDRVDSALGAADSGGAPDTSAETGDRPDPVIPLEPQVGSSGGLEEDLLTRLQAGELLKLMGLDEQLRESLAGKVEQTVRDTGVSMISAIAESLADFLIYTVLFTLCFAALLLVLKLVARALDLAFKLPGLHLLNSLGGAAIGLIEGALLLFLAVWVLRGLGVSFETELTAQTRLLSFFTTHGPLDLLLF